MFADTNVQALVYLRASTKLPWQELVDEYGMPVHRRKPYENAEEEED